MLFPAFDQHLVKCWEPPSPATPGIVPVTKFLELLNVKTHYVTAVFDVSIWLSVFRLPLHLEHQLPDPPGRKRDGG